MPSSSTISCAAISLAPCNGPIGFRKTVYERNLFTSISAQPIGFIRSPLKNRSDAPKQGYEGAPEAWLELAPEFLNGLFGISLSQEIVLITWLHKAHRDVLKVHPRGKTHLPETGVSLLALPTAQIL